MKAMPKLTRSLRAFIENQPIFFVATAAPDGRVNVSPKGADSLRVIGDTHVRWLNLSGSGNETAGHIRACNRMTLMFCSFDDRALILRLFGQATILHPFDDAWDDAIAGFPSFAGRRQIFDMQIDRVQTSCGTGVPVMSFAKDRAVEELIPHFDKLGPEGVEDFWRRKNTHTIDGLDTGILKE
ncbi:MAG: pyridoxamine 5'-phosphate oxidase family protein [Pseudomonadota bacterium]